MNWILSDMSDMGNNVTITLLIQKLVVSIFLASERLIIPKCFLKAI